MVGGAMTPTMNGGTWLGCDDPTMGPHKSDI